MSKRGATTVEYALLVLSIVFLAAIAHRNCGPTAKQNAPVGEVGR